jgi:hypothetical protein
MYLGAILSMLMFELLQNQLAIQILSIEYFCDVMHISVYLLHFEWIIYWISLLCRFDYDYSKCKLRPSNLAFVDETKCHKLSS